MTEQRVMTTSGKTIVLDAALLQEFQANLRGELIRPGDITYDATRQVWNGLVDKRPGLIVRCHGVVDVMAAVNLARKHELLVSVRGGGHNVAGHAVCDGGLMIDLSPMCAVRVDPEAQTAHVQGGAIWADVDRETQAFGLAVPGGVVSMTGVAGLTLGGGYGYLRNKYGLSCDCLRSVDMVTADGQFLTASASKNTELFWGVRGGGGNFGIVTGFEFQLFPVGPQVLFSAPAYLAQDARRGLRAWRDFIVTTPDEFTGEFNLLTGPADPRFPEPLWGKNIYLPTGLYCGGLTAGEQVTQPLRTLGEPLLDLGGPLTYLQVQTALDWFFPKAQYLHYWKSLYFDQFSDAAIDLIIDYYERRPSARSVIAIRHLGGAIQRVEATATAFGDRSSPFLVSIDANWQAAQDTEKNMAWVRDFWAALKPYSNGRLYFNFPGLLEEGDDLMRTSFGVNYARLVALKNQVDPTNLFRLNQNIKPTVRQEHGL
ncbi:MAG: FAD-binding oxidoreductase [Caldilineaceae bacterium]